jgi:GntR family transcriptional regulator/MocR family aminotransferase
VFVTNGYTGALGLITRALTLEGSSVWTEEPGYPLTRIALQLARIDPVPVRVDANGLVVADGITMAPDAVAAFLTPGQQAPMGVTLSNARRIQLLEWAERTSAWIIEDDYLSELQLKGRLAPALAADDPAGRVIQIGTFSKTISPALRLGFVVAPAALAARFGDVACCLTPAPAGIVQRTVAEFMRNGAYARHLRRMKRLYTARRDALKAHLGAWASVEGMAGLAILLHLPDGSRDTEIAAQARALDMSPSPLSTWYADPQSRRAGLMLGIANVPDRGLAKVCAQLEELIRRYG